MFAVFKLTRCVIFSTWLLVCLFVCLFVYFCLFVCLFFVCFCYGIFVATRLLNDRTLFVLQLAMGVKEYCKSKKFIPQHLHQGFVDTYVLFSFVCTVLAQISNICLFWNADIIWKNRLSSREVWNNWSIKYLTQPICGLWYLFCEVSFAHFHRAITAVWIYNIFFVQTSKSSHLSLPILLGHVFSEKLTY